MSNNTDIYRLVEEMNKAKAKKEVNDIFSMLDEVQKENNMRSLVMVLLPIYQMLNMAIMIMPM